MSKKSFPLFAEYCNSNFMLLWGAIFLSLVGSQLLVIAYSAFIFETLGKANLTSLIFVVDWGMAIVVATTGAALADRYPAKKMLIVLNFFTAVVTSLFFFCLEPDMFSFALIVIALRSLLFHTMRSARMRALFDFFTPEERTLFTPVLNSAYYIAIGLAGLLGIVLLNFVNFKFIVILDVSAFLISSLLFASIIPKQDCSQSEKDYSWWQNLKEGGSYILKNKAVLDSVFYIVLVASFFQGSYSVLMSVIPQKQFELGKSGTSMYFFMMSIGITIGTFGYQYLKRRGFTGGTQERLRTLQGIGLAVAVYIFVGIIPILYLNLLAFLFMTLCYELVWIHQLTRIIENCKGNIVGRVTGLQNAIGFTTMAGVSYLSSLSIDNIGIAFTILATMGLLMIVTFIWEFSWKTYSLGVATK